MDLKLSMGLQVCRVLWVHYAESRCTCRPEPRIVQHEIAKRYQKTKAEEMLLWKCQFASLLRGGHFRHQAEISNIPNTDQIQESPVIFLYLENSSLHEKPWWDTGFTVIGDVCVGLCPQGSWRRIQNCPAAAGTRTYSSSCWPAAACCRLQFCLIWLMKLSLSVDSVIHLCLGTETIFGLHWLAVLHKMLHP